MKKLVGLSLTLLFLAPDVANAVSCVQCCREGRWVSNECRRRCNSCQQYADESAAEGHDYPD